MSAGLYGSSFGGRDRIRLRETHLRDHLAPLLADAAHGAVKLDIVLRGLTPFPASSGTPGLLPETVTWEHLHDLVRPADFYGENKTLKRKWVSDKLLRLEGMGLICRESVAGSRSRILVLRDDGSGATFDDPTGEAENSYMTFQGSLIAFGRLTGWKSPQIAAYLAAMIAERYARADSTFAAVHNLASRPLGAGMWYRPLSWFADQGQQRPLSHIRVPFNERTLRRGIGYLKQEGLLATAWVMDDPRTGKTLKHGPRVLYQNGFDDVRTDQRRPPKRPRTPSRSPDPARDTRER